MKALDTPLLLGAALAVAGVLAGTAYGQYQLPSPAIDLLPNSPATYQMRDWQAVATNFDALAFNTAATGQFLPLVRIDATPQSPQLQTSFGFPSYVGETRTFGETGEPVHEAVASLAAVLGGTLVGVDKTVGPNNWVAMTREYYVDRNSQFVVLNTPFSTSGKSAWYETYPDILFYSIADRYPNEPSLQTILNTVDLRFYFAVNKLTAGGVSPNFNHTAFNFSTQQPVDNGVWREPDMGMGMAWLQHAAYWRKRDTDPSLAALHLNAVDWSLMYYQQTSANPDYEVLLPFGVYTAARMNAEEGRNYDIQKMMNWVFTRSNARPTKTMISGEPWGGQDAGGLMGFTVPNTGADVRGYAFSMNTFATAWPIVPLVRYEDRYSRAIGKWMLNAANAARLFYANAHPPQNQSSEFWTGDPQSAVAYEGLRHHWYGANDSEELFAGGDPLTFNWGPQTDFGIYGSALSGVFGSIIKTTNVEKVLQLDLLATDSYRAAAYPTYLYYNPLASPASVAINLGAGQLFDLYDAASNRFLARGGRTNVFQCTRRRRRCARDHSRRREANFSGTANAGRRGCRRLQRRAASRKSCAKRRRRRRREQCQPAGLLEWQPECRVVDRSRRQPDPFLEIGGRGPASVGGMANVCLPACRRRRTHADAAPGSGNTIRTTSFTPACAFRRTRRRESISPILRSFSILRQAARRTASRSLKRPLLFPTLCGPSTLPSLRAVTSKPREAFLSTMYLPRYCRLTRFG